MIDLAKELQDFIDRNDFANQTEVACAIGISDRWVRHILNGGRVKNPTFIVGAIMYYEKHKGESK